MGKLSDAFPYLAVAALAATGVGLAGAGAAAGAGAGTAAAAGAGTAGALGAAGTQTGLALGSALGTGAAVAPEAAFLASMGASSPAVAPLATEAAAASLAPNTGHFMGSQYGGIPEYANYTNIASPMAGVTPPTTPVGANLDTSYADILSKPKGDYAFMGGHDVPQWKQMTGMGDVTSYAVEEGTKTLMDQLGIDKSTAFQLASQFYAGSMEAPPNFQGQPVAPTGRQRTYSPSTMAQIMNRNRSNINRQIRRSTV